MTPEYITDLNDLFYPKSVAIVGASPNRRSRANQWITAYLHQGFSGSIFPVHPSADRIMALKAYKRVTDIPEPVDLVHFAVPFTAVIPIIKDCVQKGVKFVHLFTAGFSETGEAENIKLEEEMITIAKKGGIRLIGPNCMGLYCPEGGIAWGADFPTVTGSVGFISQSGQLASQFINEGAREYLKYSKVVSYGNASDLQHHDFLHYLANDDRTEIIGSYIEGLKNGRAFFETARKVTRKKPLVIWKGGQTEGGARATQSHTASLAGSSKIWQALCRQAGIISVDSMDELISTVVALQKIPLPKGNRVAILGGAGGGSVTMTDIAEKEGLKVPHLSDQTVRELKKIVPISGTSVKNPLDIGFSSIYNNPDEFLKLYSLLRDDPNIDAVLFSRGIFRRRGSGGRHDLDFLTRMTLKGIEIVEKPVLVVLQGGKSIEWEALREEAQAKYWGAGIATFDSFPSAARVLNNLNEYRKFLDTPE